MWLVHPRLRSGLVRSSFLWSAVLVAALVAAPAFAQGWATTPRAVFDLEEDYGDNKRLDEKGEEVVGVSSTDLPGGRRGMLLVPPEMLVDAGYELRATATVEQVIEGRYSNDVRCRVTWVLTNTSSGPLQPRITAFASGIAELDQGIAGQLPLAPGQSASTFQERIHKRRCKLRLRNIAGPTFNPEAPETSTYELDEESGGDCLSGDRLAATLLVPYFEVDMADAAGITTLMSTVNADDGCTLSRVTLWTDLAVPTLSFYVYLSPNDVQTINLRDLFAGNLPQTSGVLADTSCPVLDFDVCTADQIDVELTQLQLRSLSDAHSGRPDVEDGTCAGVDHGDGVARGFVTVDVVDRCTHPATVETWALPEWQDPDGYHAATATGARNALWGDYFLVDPDDDFAQSEPAVAVPADPGRFEPGDYTFYGRYNGFEASDGRRPLSGHHGIRYLQGGPFDGGTELLVWRDTRSPEVAPPLCGQLPEWAPLGQRAIGLYDEEELPFQPPSGAVFPWATQRQQIGGTDFPSPPFGWLDLDLWHDATTPAQSWVTAVVSARGRFSVQHRATRLDELCTSPAKPPEVP